MPMWRSRTIAVVRCGDDSWGMDDLCRCANSTGRGGSMPGDPKECRQRALRCTELAEKATDPELKAVLKSLVKRWLKLAVELKHAQAAG